MNHIKRNHILIGSGVLLLSIAIAVMVMRLVKPPVVHYHAGFRIYINGMLQDYTGDRYMAPLECVVNAAELTDPSEKIHLHNHVGDVAHIHSSGVVWGDLFADVNLVYDPGTALTAYVNGKESDNITNQPIMPYDSLVLLIGTHANPQQYLAYEVTKDHIIEVEKSKEGCGR